VNDLNTAQFDLEKYSDKTIILKMSDSKLIDMLYPRKTHNWQ